MPASERNVLLMSVLLFIFLHKLISNPDTREKKKRKNKFSNELWHENDLKAIWSWFRRQNFRFSCEVVLTTDETNGTWNQNSKRNSFNPISATTIGVFNSIIGQTKKWTLASLFHQFNDKSFCFRKIFTKFMQKLAAWWVWICLSIYELCKRLWS